MKARVIVKTAMLITTVLTYNAVMNFVSPIVANELAMAQMNNSIDSSLCIQLYTYLRNYERVAFAIFIAALFSKEVYEIIKKLKEKRNGKES